ncbi:hypothetical protein B0T14DRAFT_513543 [Immersiella caudata]|uniref:Uncharacterized protein n=1 Tax=Immersiella caudata TaxID=314043 RepID=A0AA39X608_9PEZI|nr:hypothetical protein B0T14DRAFT_513543 [Immersiella caudata]
MPRLPGATNCRSRKQVPRKDASRPRLHPNPPIAGPSYLPDLDDPVQDHSWPTLAHGVIAVAPAQSRLASILEKALLESERPSRNPIVRPLLQYRFNYRDREGRLDEIDSVKMQEQRYSYAAVCRYLGLARFRQARSRPQSFPKLGVSLSLCSASDRSHRSPSKERPPQVMAKSCVPKSKPITCSLSGLTQTSLGCTAGVAHL